MRHLLLLALALAACSREASAPAANTAPTAAPVEPKATADVKTDVKIDVKIVAPAELAKLRESTPNLAIIDANPKAVYDKGHVPGAKLLESDDVKTVLPADHAAPVVFYCYNDACGASHAAAKDAIAAGWTNVSRMKAGIAGWKAAGLPVEM
jgi:rhodanese-related sulfurtransferase